MCLWGAHKAGGPRLRSRLSSPPPSPRSPPPPHTHTASFLTALFRGASPAAAPSLDPPRGRSSRWYPVLLVEGGAGLLYQCDSPVLTPTRWPVPLSSFLQSSLLTEPSLTPSTEITQPFNRCQWKCSSPVCNQVCEPICEQPRCSTRCQELGCSKCEIKCDKPECEVRCPVKHCEKGACPKCDTVCKEPACHTECTNPTPACESVCEEPLRLEVPPPGGL